MAATNKKSNLRSIIPLLLIVVMMFESETHMKVEAQGCTSSLGNLNVCAPFVVPGATNTSPSTECCNALQAMDHGCLCNTIRVSARLPARCHLPPLSCPAN